MANAAIMPVVTSMIGDTVRVGPVSSWPFAAIIPDEAWIAPSNAAIERRGPS